MRKRLLGYAAIGCFWLAALTTPGCVDIAYHAERIHAATEGPIYKSVVNTLPPLRDGSTRIYFYRPHVLLGFAASPIVIVNGHWMGTKGKPNENLLLPGCVFFVDSRDSTIDVWLYQAGKEDIERKISFHSGKSKTYFVSEKLHPTYMDLEVINSATAMKEIRDLHFSGYRNLTNEDAQPSP